MSANANPGRRIKAVIFDLDGVLVDSESVFRDCYCKIVQEHTGRKVPKQYFNKFVGKKETEISRELSKDFGLSIPYTRLFSERVAYFSGLKRIRRMPGALRTVRTLSSRLPLAVASSSERRHVLKMLRLSGLARFFKTIVYFELAGKRKPAPDLYLLAAKRLGIPPANCLAIEDSATGVLSAKRAGMFAVAVRTELAKDQDFSLADYIVPNISAAGKLVLKLTKEPFGSS